MSSLELVSAAVGLVVIVAILLYAVALLGRPRERYLGDSTPTGRRSFRETMLVWLMGPKN